ncbi:MAG: hypothetical protein KGS60_12735 [Verrucomicrobia bacterium]|nr:hypothetical protein [Verrucomicrobiota bacterium]
MNITASAAGLAGLTKDLMRVWDETGASWRDAKAAEFFRGHLAPVVDSVGSMGVAAEELDRVLRQIHADCE